MTNGLFVFFMLPVCFLGAACVFLIGLTFVRAVNGLRKDD